MDNKAFMEILGPVLVTYHNLMLAINTPGVKRKTIRDAQCQYDMALYTLLKERNEK